MALSIADKNYISLFHHKMTAEDLAKDIGCSIKMVSTFVKTLPLPVDEEVAYDNSNLAAAPTTFVLSIQDEKPTYEQKTHVIPERFADSISKINPDKPSR